MKDKVDVWLYIFTAVIFFTLLVIIWTHAIYLSSDNLAHAIWSEMKLLGAAIEKWQPLIGSFIATIAAGGTVWAIFRQIQNSNDTETKRLEREFMAQKALLRFSLINISEYTNDCWNKLFPLAEAINHDIQQEKIVSRQLGQKIWGENSQALRQCIDHLRENQPAFPKKTDVAQIAETLKFSTEMARIDGQLISEFLHCLQIQNSRLSILFETNAGIRDALCRRLMELSELDRRLDRLFEVARGRETSLFSRSELENIGYLQLRSARNNFRDLHEIVSAMAKTHYDSMCTPPTRFDR